MVIGIFIRVIENMPLLRERFSKRQKFYITGSDVRIYPPAVVHGSSVRCLELDFQRVGDRTHATIFTAMGVIENLYTPARRDRKSTRLNSSHVKISYAVFCLKKKKQ